MYYVLSILMIFSMYCDMDFFDTKATLRCFIRIFSIISLWFNHLCIREHSAVSMKNIQVKKKKQKNC